MLVSLCLPDSSLLTLLSSHTVNCSPGPTPAIFTLLGKLLRQKQHLVPAAPFIALCVTKKQPLRDCFGIYCPLIPYWKKLSDTWSSSLSLSLLALLT